MFRQAFGYSPWRGKGWGGPRHRPAPSGGRRAQPGAEATRLGARQSPDLLRRRQEQVLLATLINHPSLLLESAEDLADFNLSGAEYQRLRAALLDAVADDLLFPGDLDSARLRCHLSEVGFSGILDGILSPDVYVHGKFARPDASSEAAALGLLHLLSLFREREAAADGEEAWRELASDMSDEALARLQARTRLSREGSGRDVDLDRLGGLVQEDWN